MPVRMKDIAHELGVSVVTVSKVLRNHQDIGEETRRRVLAKIKELDYQPNFAARALVTGRTYTIGLVVPDLVHPFFAQIAKSLSGALRKRGYSLIIASSDEDVQLEREEIARLLARRVDVMVIASAQNAPESFARIEAAKTPYILIDRCLPGLDAPFIGVDDEAVGRIATEHLIALGRCRIAHIRGPEISTGLARMEGYRSALARRKLGPLDGYIASAASGDADSESKGRAAMSELLRLDPRPDAVFCYNDPTAMGAMNAILDAGLRVPEDVAVIGCGNVHYDASLRVPLSSIDQQTAAIGERTARLALTLIESKTPPRSKSMVLEPQLVVRASTQA